MLQQLVREALRPGRPELGPCDTFHVHKMRAIEPRLAIAHSTGTALPGRVRFRTVAAGTIAG
jgi:hypothetical protein